MGQDLDRIRENIVTLRLLRMTQVLELTEEQTAKIYPVIARIEKEKTEIQKELGLLMREIRDIVRTGTDKGGKIEEKLDNIKELKAGIRTKEEEIENFLASQLTPLQRAKYLLFSVEFYQGLGEKLERARIYRNRGPFRR
jgi:Spy/CpxP family protein refolding chaperone